jgi:hypothetical protein
VVPEGIVPPNVGLKVVPEQITNVRLLIAATGKTETVAENAVPAHPAELGVMLYVAVCIELALLFNVPLNELALLPLAPPVILLVKLGALQV